jgi:hypothetical protein
MRLAAVQAGLLNGKSISFLPLKVDFADQKASEKDGWPPEILVIDEWLLLEYAVCFLPANQDALDKSVRKAGHDHPADFLQAMAVDPSRIVLGEIGVRGHRRLFSILPPWMNSRSAAGAAGDAYRR